MTGSQPLFRVSITLQKAVQFRSRFSGELCGKHAGANYSGQVTMGLGVYEAIVIQGLNMRVGSC